MRRTVRFFWQDGDATSGFRAGVSLHSHTNHSRESLGFLPRWVSDVPLISWELARQTCRYQTRHGRPPDFASAYWTSPLSSVEAFDLERTAIENDLALHGIVSLTDHDTIDAGLELQALGRQTPLSLEWTVPFTETFFHLGIHNLSPITASETMQALASYTRQPDAGVLAETLTWLDAQPGILIVLNHPLWDQANLGPDHHRAILGRFLATYGDRIHALELNGLRPWRENRMVAELAGALGHPVISGGDRHGREPNAVVNLTNATTLAAFADEVRSGYSHVLFLPQYREPLPLRILEALFDVLQHREELPVRKAWTDRVFYTRNDGSCVPLSDAWANGGPVAVRCFVRGVELAGCQRTQQMLRRMVKFALPRAWPAPAAKVHRPTVTTHFM